MEKKKLNLNAIKHPVINNLQDDKKEEDIYKRSENEETKTLDDNIVKESWEKEELINEDEISQKDNILIEKENWNEENENEEKKWPAIKISFASIKKNQNLDTTSKNSDDEKDKNLKNSLEEKKSDDEDKVIIHKKDDNLKDLFWNYESKFEKDKKTIIEKLKKLKVIPKTRLWFLFSLTIITIIGISVLFYIDPKTHSIENYKVSLLNIFNWNKTSNEDSTDLVVNNTWSSEEVKIEKISVWWYAFEISVKDVKWEEKIYIYNMKLYKDKKVLLNQLNKVVETLKKEKLINILSEKYSKEK